MSLTYVGLQTLLYMLADDDEMQTERERKKFLLELYNLLCDLDDRYSPQICDLLKIIYGIRNYETDWARDWFETLVFRSTFCCHEYKQDLLPQARNKLLKCIVSLDKLLLAKYNKSGRVLLAAPEKGLVKTSLETKTPTSLQFQLFRHFLISAPAPDETIPDELPPKIKAQLSRAHHSYMECDLFSELIKRYGGPSYIVRYNNNQKKFTYGLAPCFVPCCVHKRDKRHEL